MFLQEPFPRGKRDSKLERSVSFGFTSSQSNAGEISESGDDYILVFTIRSAHPELDQQIRADVELDNQWTIYDARVSDEDRNFVLAAGESRDVTIHLDVRDENLENLAANIVDFNVTLVVISDLDTTSRTAEITLFKPDPIPEGTDVKEVGWLAANFAIVAVGIVIMGVVLLASFRVLRDATRLRRILINRDYSMTVMDGMVKSLAPKNSLLQMKLLIQCTGIQRPLSTAPSTCRNPSSLRS